MPRGAYCSAVPKVAWYRFGNAFLRQWAGAAGMLTSLIFGTCGTPASSILLAGFSAVMVVNASFAAHAPHAAALNCADCTAQDSVWCVWCGPTPLGRLLKLVSAIESCRCKRLLTAQQSSRLMSEVLQSLWRLAAATQLRASAVTFLPCQHCFHCHS